MTHARGRTTAVFAAVLAVASALAAGGGALPALARAPLVKLHKVGDFSEPVFIDQAPGAKGLLFVVEKAGTIAVVKDGESLGQKFLNIKRRVTDSGEQGLLSMAFDPDYKRNRRFYVYYVNRHCHKGACDIEVDEFRRSVASATRANPATRERIIRVPHHTQAAPHNGGQVAFGPDGHLYLAPGDGGSQKDPENDAQRTDRLLGKVLRIDPTPGGGHTSPAGNPYADRAGRDEIYSLGLRNPFRFSFDSETGDLWITDVGYDSWEEIDHVSRAQANGANFGWHFFEGPGPCTQCGFSNPTPPPHYVPPVHAYPHSGPGETGSAIIGGYVVRDPRLPALNGDYIYTDLEVGNLRAYNPVTDQMIPLGVSVSLPSSFGQGRRGQLYLASLGGGAVYRIDPGP